MTTPTPIIVDARGLLPPEPMHLTLEALDQLTPDNEVLLLIYREPTPLFDILVRNGYRYTSSCNEAGEYEIRIRQGATA